MLLVELMNHVGHCSPVFFVASVLCPIVVLQASNTLLEELVHSLTRWRCLAQPCSMHLSSAASLLILQFAQEHPEVRVSPLNVPVPAVVKTDETTKLVIIIQHSYTWCLTKRANFGRL